MTGMCDICEGRHKSIPAVKWCPECEEKMCKECLDHHSASKISRNHTVLDIEYFSKFSSSFSEVKIYCEQHDMKYTNLCETHDKLCCPACISESETHAKCKTLLLQKVVNAVKTSTLLHSIEERLKHLNINLDKIIKARKTNIQELIKQRENIVKKIKQLKENIFNLLNSIEKENLEELDRIFNRLNTKLDSEVSSLEQRFMKTEKFIHDINIFKRYGTNMHTYIRTKTIESEISKETNFLQELVGDGYMERLGIKFEENKNVTGVIESFSSFGTISIDCTTFSFILIADKGQQVHTMISPPRGCVADINMTLKSKFLISSKSVFVYGCSFLPDNRMIFAESKYYNIVLFKRNERKEKVISTSSFLRDVTVIDDKTVAVSTDEGVMIVNIATNTVEKSTIIGRCHGLEYYNGSLIICASGKGIVSLNLSTSLITTLVQDTTDRGCYYCAVYNDKIYFSRSYYDTVTSYSMRGDKVWEFHDPSLISGPHGIAIDNNSNVYIASHSNHSIVVLSSDGQGNKILLTHTDGIHLPWALSFDRTENKLLVGNHYGPALLFNFS